MTKILLILITFLLIGCSEKGDNSIDFDDYEKVNVDNHINSIPLVPYIEANGDLFFIRNIVQNRVHLFNESNSLILPSSTGRGPFEINQIFATNYDFKSNHINIFDFSPNKIVQYKIDDFSVIDTVEYLDVIPKKIFISEPFMSSYESKFYFPVVSSTEYDDTRTLRKTLSSA